LLGVPRVLDAIHAHSQSPLVRYYPIFLNLPMPLPLLPPLLPARLIQGQLRKVLHPDFPLLVLIAYHQLQRYPKVTR